MIKQPVRLFRLTEEKADRLIEMLDMLSRQGNTDAQAIAADLYQQQIYNPSDEPLIFPTTDGQVKIDFKKEQLTVTNDKTGQSVIVGNE
jgi:hypothetical protein